jgi:hypothetical protein
VIGQRHYMIASSADGRMQYWRGRRGLDRAAGGWTFDMSAARTYRRPHDALRASKQLELDSSLEVVEVEMVLSRVCYRVCIEAVDEKK